MLHRRDTAGGNCRTDPPGPVFHILIDCAFGVLGIIPLLLCRKWIRELARQQNMNPVNRFLPA